MFLKPVNDALELRLFGNSAVQRCRFGYERVGKPYLLLNSLVSRLFPRELILHIL